MRHRALGNLLRRPLNDDAAAAVTGFRPQVNDIVGGPHELQVVLHDDQRVSDREQRLEAHMGRLVRVMVRTADELDAAHGADPFPEAAGNNTLAFFMNEPPPADLLATVRNKADDERVAPGAREVYVAYGEKGIGRSRLRIPAAEAGTARNMNTVAKLAELARELE